MSGFGVEPGSLELAVRRLEAAAWEIDRFWTERDRWLELGRLVGSDRVQRAMAVFCEYWSLALGSVSDDAAELAARLVAAAEGYATTDERVVR